MGNRRLEGYDMPPGDIESMLAVVETNPRFIELFRKRLVAARDIQVKSLIEVNDEGTRGRIWALEDEIQFIDDLVALTIEEEANE